MKWSHSFVILIFFISSDCFANDWSFKDQVRSIVHNQKTKEISRLSLAAARERSTSKDWSFLPSVSASAARHAVTRYSDTDSTTTYNDMGVDVSMNIFRFGGDFAIRNGSTETIKAAELSNKMKELSAETSAAQVLCDAISAHLEINVYEHRMTASRQSLAAAAARYRKGILSEQELAKLKLESDRLEMSFRSAKRKAAQTRDLAMKYGGDLPANVDWPLTQHPELYTRASAWINSVYSAELRLKALEASAAAASYAIGEARSALLPSLDLGIGWSRSGLPDFKNQADRREVVAKLTIPIFSGFRDYGEYQGRVHEFAVAQANLEVERALAPKQFEFSVNEIRGALEDATERQRQIAIAEQLYQDNLKRFERGLVSVNELSIDEHRVRETELAAIEAWSTVHIGLFKLAELKGTSLIDTSEIF